VIRLDRPVERGARLEVGSDALPETDDGEYYTFQLVGLEVVEEGGRSLGRVEAVVPGIANDALDLGNGLLLPLVEACVRTIDLEAARILVAPGFSEPD
jgi:16S rRNA processing protein RimM